MVFAYDETSEVRLLKRRRKDWIKSVGQHRVCFPRATASNMHTSIAPS